MPTTTPNRESTQDRDTDLTDVEALSGADWQIAGQAWEHAASDWGVVASFNGIWGGCEAALAEMARVCRPGSRIGLTYWGAPERLDLLSYFMTVGAAGPGVSEEIVSLAAINAPGVAESILSGAGFEEITFGTTQAILEFGDDETAWRALRSPGLVLPSRGLPRLTPSSVPTYNRRSRRAGTVGTAQTWA